MRIFKKIILGTVPVLLIASTALWVLTKQLNPDTVKSYLITQLNALTNLPTEINGPVEWQLLPRPGIHVADLFIGDKASSEAFDLAIKSLTLQLKLTALLKGKLVFSEVNVTNLRLNLHQDNPQNVPNKVLAPSVQPVNGPKLAIMRLLISKGRVTYQNDGINLIFKQLQLGAENVNLENKPFPLQIKSNLLYRYHQEDINATLNFRGKASLSSSFLTHLRLQNDGVYLDGQATLQDFSGKLSNLNEIKSNITLNKTTLALKPLTMSLYQGESVGNVALDLQHHLFTFDQTATNMSAERFAQDFIGVDNPRGTMDLTLHLKGSTLEHDTQSWSGHGHVSIKDGTLNHVNVQPLLVAVSESIGQYIVNKSLKLGELIDLGSFKEESVFKGATDFSLLSIPFELSKNTLSSNAILLQTNTLQIGGKGALSLQSHAIDAHLSIKELTPSPLHLTTQTLLGGYYPIVIKGTLEDPKIEPHLAILSPVYKTLIAPEAVITPVIKLGEDLGKVLDRE